MFWLSAGMMSSIQRSDLTGGLIATVLKTSDRLLCLVSDVVERKLFWILHYEANELGSLGSCDYNGSGINVINQRLRWDWSPAANHLIRSNIQVKMSESQSQELLMLLEKIKLNMKLFCASFYLVLFFLTVKVNK